MHPFDHYPVWRVNQVDISAAAVALAAAEPLTYPKKSYAPLKEMNTNAVEFLTTTIVTELSQKQRHTEVNSAAHTERAPGSDSETET